MWMRPWTRLSRRTWRTLSTAVAPAVSREPLTPLHKHLLDTIKLTGPMSVAQYMRHALVHPLGGYYMHKDVFGRRGDFITSPEVSQVFGELVGVWFVAQWKAAKCPKQVQVMELGPGRGILMADMLRTFASFPDFAKSVDSVHLVEASPFLRQVQAKSLGLSDFHDVIKDEQVYETPSGLNLCWHSALDTVPKQGWTAMVANEFFDAMPVYKFEKTSHGWREIMVDLDESESSPHHFRFIRIPAPSKASTTIPVGPRYDSFKDGDRIEVSPDAYRNARVISEFIRDTGGHSLIIDYGSNQMVGDSLRGIREHKFVPVLSNPGQSDLSTDVDFSLLHDAAKDIASSHGPMTQGDFLRCMGIVPRLQMLLYKATKEQRQELVTGYDRLMSEGSGMGKAYKVMAISEPGSSPYPFQAQAIPEPENKEA